MQAFQLEVDYIYFKYLAFAPDGLRCAAADNVGKVVIWDVDV